MTEDAGQQGRLTTVHVIVTCANRKSRPIPARLQLGQVPGRTPVQRARRWISRLAQTETRRRSLRSNSTRVSTGQSHACVRRCTGQVRSYACGRARQATA